MTSRGAALANRSAALVEDFRAHLENEPDEVERIRAALVSELAQLSAPESLTERAG